MSEIYIKDFPFEIKDVEPELNKELLSKFNDEEIGFIRVGPKGYLYPKRYEREAALYYNMPVRPSDVFVVTFHCSGTTMTQELVWLIGNDLDYQKAADISLLERFPLLEVSHIFHPTLINELKEVEGNEALVNTIEKVLTKATSPVSEKLHEAPSASPRFIKTHLPLSLLPPALADTARVVYVARDPRDVAVSFYHLLRSLRIPSFKGDFKSFWNYFIKDLIYRSPYFEHVKEAWQKRHNGNVLFLFYEELSEDMPNTIRKVAKFLNKPITDEQVEKLSEHLKIDNYKKKESVNVKILKDIGFFIPGGQSFIRKEKVGEWRDYFDEEMTKQAERWISDNLRGTDLRFPSIDDQINSNVGTKNIEKL